MKNRGYCVCCDQEVIFSSENDWLRDYYKCSHCSSIPRERALMYCMDMYYPQWRELNILESSPIQRGASLKIGNECRNYISTHYIPDKERGGMVNGFRNEDLELMTFQDEAFDLVVTQDVMEHILNPVAAFSEIGRILKNGGAHIFTVPLVNKEKATAICAERKDGRVILYNEPEYHSNPLDNNGSLVTRRWGYDICHFIYRASGLTTAIVYIDNVDLGIRAEYIEVLVSRKNNESMC